MTPREALMKMWRGEDPTDEDIAVMRQDPKILAIAVGDVLERQRYALLYAEIGGKYAPAYRFRPWRRRDARRAHAEEAARLGALAERMGRRHGETR